MDCKQSNFSASKEEYMNKQKPMGGSTKFDTIKSS